MTDPVTTRENWQLLTRAAYGLSAVSQTLDDVVGQTAMGPADQEYLHGLTAGVVVLAQTINRLVIGMDDELIIDRLAPVATQASAA